jgi:cell division transport system ATP-binding protein
MVELHKVVKIWSQTVLDHIDLKVSRGDFIYLVGDSGAGKTTLLKLITGEIIADRGLVEVFNKNIAKIEPSALQLIRRKIGIIFQDYKLIEELSAFDNILLSLEVARDEMIKKNLKTSFKQSVEEVIKWFKLEKLKNKKISELSGGEKRKVAAARAVVRMPELLIADEPTGGLDKDQTYAMMDIFQKLNMSGMTIILATHDREIVRRVRKKSCVLKNGRLTIEDGISLF